MVGDSPVLPLPVEAGDFIFPGARIIGERQTDRPENQRPPRRLVVQVDRHFIPGSSQGVEVEVRFAVGQAIIGLGNVGKAHIDRGHVDRQRVQVELDEHLAVAGIAVRNRVGIEIDRIALIAAGSVAIAAVGILAGAGAPVIAAIVQTGPGLENDYPALRVGAQDRHRVRGDLPGAVGAPNRDRIAPYRQGTCKGPDWIGRQGAGQSVQAVGPADQADEVR